MSYQIPLDSNMIYESPDGGNTIYARKPNSADRELVYCSSDAMKNNRWNLWRDILSEAERNTALEDVVKQAEMLYQVVRSK